MDYHDYWGWISILLVDYWGWISIDYWGWISIDYWGWITMITGDGLVLCIKDHSSTVAQITDHGLIAISLLCR